MTKTEKYLGIGVLIAIVIAIGAYVHQSTAPAVPAASPVAEELGATGTRFPNGIAMGRGVSIANVGGITVGTASSTYGSQGTPTYYTYAGRDYAVVQQAFSTTATNTPIFIGNPFGSATSSFGADGIQVQITGGTLIGDLFFDIATSSAASTNATTSSVLVKAINIPATASPGPQYDATFFPNTATSTASTAGVPAGVLPGVSGAAGNYGASNWFLRGSTPSEGVMLRIASTSVAQLLTGSVSVIFVKP